MKVINGFRNRYPHCWLLSGPSGCGKTTVARIMRRKLKCIKRYFQEYNAAASRGIDTIRDIARQVNTRPMEGEAKIFLLDECFHPNTMVNIPLGEKRIGDITEGDIVVGIDGNKMVEKVFQNKVELSRVCRVSLSNGKTIYCSVDHEFLTTEGWVKAKLLKGSRLLSTSSYNVCKEGLNDDSSMCLLPKTIHPKLEEPTEMLFQELRTAFTTEKTRTRFIREKEMPGMFDFISSSYFVPEEILYPILPSCEQNQTSGIKSQIILQKNQDKNISSTETLQKESRRDSIKQTVFCENANFQSNEIEENNSKDDTDQKEKRNTTNLERKTRREWKRDDGSTKKAIQPIEQELDSRIPSFTWSENSRISDQLQNRYSESDIEIRNRSRWEEPQIEKGYIERCEKDEQVEETWVVDIKSYQRGDNEEHFLGVIEDKEKNQGYVEFIDLQVSGHPSYFANGVPVHNCHMLTKDAQNALLKVTEDCPEWVYFFFCTTDPNKLIKTLVTRCTEIKIRGLTAEDMIELVTEVAKKEKLKLDSRVVSRIVEVSDGSARKALKVLDQISQLTEKKDQLNAIQASDARNEAFDLVKALMPFRGPPQWSEVQKVIKNLESDDYEGVRRLVIAVCSTHMLNNNGMAKRAAQVFNRFQYNWYDTGKAGLIASCYEATFGV